MTHIILKVFLLCCLLEGSLCQEWATMLPSSVQGMSGSCVRIPCRFTMPPDWDRFLDRTCAAIWMRGYSRTLMFDSRLTREESALRNVLQGNLTGNLQEKDCSTILEDMTEQNEYYYFRLECDNSLKFIFYPSVLVYIKDSAPVPTIIPNKAEVQEGTALVLECWTPAHCPILPPLLTWTPQLGDVTEVVIEAEGEKVASVIAVTNFNATYQHNKLEVTCSAIYRRQAGRTEVSTRSLLRLQVLHGPKNTSVSYPGPVTAGTSVTLTCNTIANPAVSGYFWYLVDGGQVTQVGRRKRLTIDVTEDSPSFQCGVINTYGEQSSSVTTIDVQFPPKDTTVIVEPPGVILEGTPIILLCHSQAKPPVHNYSWSINGGEYLVIGDILTLDPAQPRHTGEYRCMAKNAVGEEASPVVHLDVQYPPKNTTVSMSPPGSLPDGSTVTLRCASVANPPSVNVTWYRVNAGEKTPMGSGQEMTFNVTKLSRDTFYCENRNVHGGQSARPIAIDVTFAPEILTSSHCQDVSAQTRCTCNSQANPPPSLQWELSGVLVNHSDESPITDEALDSATRRSVVIVQRLDGEEFVSSLVCISSNPFGFDTLAFNMSSSPAARTDVTVLVGSAVGVVTMLILSLLLLLYICRKTKGTFPSNDRQADNATDILVTNETHTSDGNAIYANDKDLTKEAAPDDEQLHYAHVNVIQLQARDRAEIRGLSSVTSEYAEIRLRPAESDKGEEPQADTEPDPEPDPEPEEEKMVADTPSGQEVASEDVAASTA